MSNAEATNTSSSTTPTETSNSLITALLHLILAMAFSRRGSSRGQLTQGEVGEDEEILYAPISTSSSGVRDRMDDGEAHPLLNGVEESDREDSTTPASPDISQGEVSIDSEVPVLVNTGRSSSPSSHYLPHVAPPVTSSPSLGPLARPNPRASATLVYALENEPTSSKEPISAPAPILPSTSRFPSPDPCLYAFEEVSEMHRDAALDSLASPTSSSRSSEDSTSMLDLSLVSDCSTVGSDETEAEELGDTQLSKSTPVVASAAAGRLLANLDDIVGIHLGEDHRETAKPVPVPMPVRELPIGVVGLGILGVAKKDDSEIIFLRSGERGFGRDVINRRVDELRRHSGGWIAGDGRWDETVSGGRSSTFRKNGLTIDVDAYRASWNWKRDIRRSVILEEDEEAIEEPNRKGEELGGRGLSALLLNQVLVAYDSDEVMAGYRVNELTPILECDGEREEMMEEEASTSGSSYSDDEDERVEEHGQERGPLLARPRTPYATNFGRRGQRQNASGSSQRQKQRPSTRRSLTPSPQSTSTSTSTPFKSRCQSKENLAPTTSTSLGSTSRRRTHIRVRGPVGDREKGFLDTTISSRCKRQSSTLGSSLGGGVGVGVTGRVWRV